jgi:hypothetical protein
MLAIYVSENGIEFLHSTVNLSQITIRNHLRRLEADTNLKTSWAPVDKLDSALSFKSSDSSMDIVRHNITTIQEASSHVLSVTWVTLHHLVVGLEARHGNLLNGVGLVRCLGCRDNWSIGDEREMDAWIWDQVGLEFVQIDIERTIKAERSCDRRNNCNLLAEIS